MITDSGVLIVTGGSRGIGAAICRLAAARGYSVAVNYHTGKASANAPVEEIQFAGGSAVAIQADIGNESDIVRLFQQSDETLGPLTALVNNAAITGGFSYVDRVKAD